MENSALASQTVQLIVVLLAQAGVAAAQKVGHAVGDSSVQAAKRLYARIKGKLAGDAGASAALKQLENRPQSEGRQAALREVLEQKLRDDRQFADDIRGLVAELRQSRGDVITQSISNTGKAGNITQIGKLG